MSSCAPPLPHACSLGNPWHACAPAPHDGTNKMLWIVTRYCPLPPIVIYRLQDGTAKMSKSAESDLSRINLLDTPDEIARKIKRCVTARDSMGQQRTVGDTSRARSIGHRHQPSHFMDGAGAGPGLLARCRGIRHVPRCSPGWRYRADVAPSRGVPLPPPTASSSAARRIRSRA